MSTTIKTETRKIKTTKGETRTIKYLFHISDAGNHLVYKVLGVDLKENDEIECLELFGIENKEFVIAHNAFKDRFDEDFGDIPLYNNIRLHKIKKLIIGDGIKGIAISVFNSLKIQELEIRGSCNVIGTAAFENCKELVSVKIFDGCREIKESAFSNCSKLKNLELCNTIEKIGPMAFANDINLKKVIWPEYCEFFSGYCFSGCKELSEIVIKGKSVHIVDNVFDGSKISSIDLSFVAIAKFAHYPLMNKNKEITVKRSIYGIFKKMNIEKARWDDI